MKSAQKNFMKENAQLFQETPSGLEKAKQLQQVTIKIDSAPFQLLRKNFLLHKFN